MTRNWIDDVKGTIPEYAESVAETLQYSIDDAVAQLDEITVHGCALAAATATANGGLAFEISMNGPLFGSDEREIAKKVAVLLVMEATCMSYPQYTGGLTNDWNQPNHNAYAFAAAIAMQHEKLINYYSSLLTNGGINVKAKSAIVKIAAAIAAIGKIT
jgi:hypothetical protein